jgi:hypothetical protein
MFSWLLPAWGQHVAQNPSTSAEILDDPSAHHVITCLRNLVVVGGGGTWPPKATYRDSWPLPLRPYDSVYKTMEVLFPVEESSVDNTVNRKIIDSFRLRMRTLLETHVSVGDVLLALERAESESDSCPQSAWLGYFACVAFLRHAYRCVRFLITYNVS